MKILRILYNIVTVLRNNIYIRIGGYLMFLKKNFKLPQPVTFFYLSLYICMLMKRSLFIII